MPGDDKVVEKAVEQVGRGMCWNVDSFLVMTNYLSLFCSYSVPR